MFGLEIRRKGNIANLYSDVDTVLARAGVMKGQVPAHIQASSVAHALQKMLAGNYFDICTVNKCAEVVGLHIPSERKRVYDAQHCVHWSDMLPEFREVVVAMLLDDFREVLTFDNAKEVAPTTT